MVVVWQDNIKMDFRNNTFRELGTDRYSSGQGEVASSIEQESKRFDSIKRYEVLDQLRYCQLLKNDFAPWSDLVIV